MLSLFAKVGLSGIFKITGDSSLLCWMNSLDTLIAHVSKIQDPGVDGRVILRWILKEVGLGGGAWTGLISLRIGTSGGHL